jgi:hypothetical protein
MVSNKIVPMRVSFDIETNGFAHAQALVDDSSEKTAVDNMSSIASASSKKLGQAAVAAAKTDKNVPTGLIAKLRGVRCINLSIVLLLVTIPVTVVFTIWAAGFGGISTVQVQQIKDGLFRNIILAIEADLDATEQIAQSLAAPFDSNVFSSLNQSSIDTLLWKHTV